MAQEGFRGLGRGVIARLYTILQAISAISEMQDQAMTPLASYVKILSSRIIEANSTAI